MTKAIKRLNYTVEVIIFFLILSLLADFIEKIGVINKIPLPKFNKYLKLFFLIYSLLIISTYKFKNKSIRYVFLFIPICFFFIFFIKTYYIRQIPALIRNFFLIGIIPFFYIIKEHNLEKLKEKTYSILKIIIGINFLIIIIGMIFDIQLFRTYYINRIRFGFNGVLLNQVQPVYFYTSLLFIFYKRSIFFLLLTFLCGLMLGTKALYIIMCLFSIFIAFNSYKENKRRVVTIVIVSIMLLIIVFYFLFFSKLFAEIILKDGFFTAFFSYRNVYLIQILNEINTENFNILFGTISLTDYRSEFSFIDVVLFLGIIGLVFYLMLMRNVYKFFVGNSSGKVYFILIMLIAGFSGNFFSFPFNCFMFMLTLSCLYKKEHEKMIIYNA